MTQPIFQQRIRVMIFVLVCMMLLMPFISGCGKKQEAMKEGIAFTTKYQAVFMDNGKVFFGRLANMGSTYPVLMDVFYIRQQTNPNTKEVKNILIRRGNEWHGPDRMYINASHISVIEPVSEGSQVAKLIKEADEQKPAGK